VGISRLNRADPRYTIRGAVRLPASEALITGWAAGDTCTLQADGGSTNGARPGNSRALAPGNPRRRPKLPPLTTTTEQLPDP
jgi:hypothetical protein